MGIMTDHVAISEVKDLFQRHLEFHRYNLQLNIGAYVPRISNPAWTQENNGQGRDLSASGNPRMSATFEQNNKYNTIMPLIFHSNCEALNK